MKLVKTVPVVEYYGVDGFGMSWGGRLDNPLSGQLTDHLDGDTRRFFVARVLPPAYNNRRFIKDLTRDEKLEIADEFHIGQHVLLKTEQGEELEGVITNILNDTTAKVTIKKTGKSALVDITQVEPKGLKKFKRYEKQQKPEKKQK